MRYLSWVLCLISSVLLFSCDSKDDEPQDSTIKLSIYDISVPSSGGIYTVTLESAGYISSAHSSVDWISLGFKGNAITIEAIPNTQSKERSGYIEVRNNKGESAIVDVVQYGKNSTGNNDNIGDGRLNAPTNIKAVQNGNSIVVTWDAVKGASRYEVFHSGSADGNYKSYGYWTNNKFVDEVVIITDNYYKIKAIGSTESELSEYAYCRFSSNSGSGNSSKPSVPTGLKAIQRGNSIVVSWNAVDNAYYYRLWYSNPSGDENFTNVYSPSTSAVFDRNMKDGTYKFWIQTLNSKYEESDKSTKVSCSFKSNGSNTGGDGPSKLQTPQNVEAYSGGSFVQISFDEVSLAYQYELYRSSSATSGYAKISASGGSTSGNRYILTDSNPKNGTSYYKVSRC